MSRILGTNPQKYVESKIVPKHVHFVLEQGPPTLEWNDNLNWHTFEPYFQFTEYILVGIMRLMVLMKPSY